MLILQSNGRPRPAPRPRPSPHHGTAEDRREWEKLCRLQRLILPQAAPDVPGYALALAYRPAFVVTGDYHDFFRHPDGRTGVFVGDASGHGPAAGMLMAIMRTILRTHDLHGDPGPTLRAAGRLFHREIPSDMFMTGVYAALGPGGRVTWASAGHHPPLWVTRAGDLHPLDLTVGGPVLGLDPAYPYPTVEFRLGPGDRLLLFTDGLWDARSRAGEPFTRLRIWDHLRFYLEYPLGEAVADLVRAVKGHLEGADFEDDFTILGIERTA